MPDATYVYARPEILDSETGILELDEALALLAAELDFDPEVVARGPGEISATVPGASLEETWRAMDRAVPQWKQRRLFLLPRP